jgi:oxygen-independent coproporphyrinogen-3 oxidase
MDLELIPDAPLKFNSVVPIYNWYYPLSYRQRLVSPETVYTALETKRVKSRALYVHIPFCETICWFCPFSRTKLQDPECLESYTRALLREIDIKSRHAAISDIPVRSIFFGGGTPSVLTADQMLRVGNVLRSRFDLSDLREFSFEMTPRSVTPEKLEAMQEIGVTHPRFGIQSFDPGYRRYFGLTTPIDTIRDCARTLVERFPHPSFDMLYGMDGQTEEEFARDVEQAVDFGVANIAYYPINNVVTQTRLHRAFARDGRHPTSGLTKFYMNVLLRQYMEASGYLPHNGHEFVRVSDSGIENGPVTTPRYTFHYHEHVYGYREQEVLGFGSSALSTLNRFLIVNGDDHSRYVRSLLQEGRWDFTVFEHDPVADAGKGVILHLPYHGELEKGRIDWDKVHPETRHALHRVVDAGLVRDTGDGYALTLDGWYWYVNLIYYLCPREERNVIDLFIRERCASADRHIGDTRVPG